MQLRRSVPLVRIDAAHKSNAAWKRNNGQRQHFLYKFDWGVVMGFEMDWTHAATAGGTTGIIYAASKLFPVVSEFLSSQRKSKRDDNNSEKDENRKEASFLQERYEKWILNLEQNLKDIKHDMDEKEKSRVQMLVDIALKDMDNKILTKKNQEFESELTKLRGEQ